MSHKQNNPSFLSRILKRWFIHLFLFPISLPIEYLAFRNQPDQREKRQEAVESEKIHIDNLPEKEKTAYLKEKKSESKNTTRLWLIGIFWFLAGPPALLLYVQPDQAYKVLIGFIIVSVGIWLQPAKGEGVFENRFKNLKDHKLRLGLTVIAFVLALFPFFSLTQENPPVQKEEVVQSDSVIADDDSNLSDSEKVLKASQELQKTLDEMDDGSEPGIDSFIATTYEIMKTEDQSRKAMTKLLSEYTAAEIEALPMDKKMLYRVVLPPDLKEAQVEPTIHKIISDITSQDKDIDEIGLFLFSDKEIVDGPWDLGKVIWAPNGELGHVTPEIAQNNVREGYETTIEVKENLEEYLKNRNTSEEKNGLSEEERKAIFKELVLSERRASSEAEAEFPIDGTQEQVKKMGERMNELEAKYDAEIYSKYGINKDIETEITVEALEKNWPYPED